MNVVIWVRVSCQDQKDEGFSIDAQLRANRQKAEREGWKVLREFVVTESAKAGVVRKEFNAMMDWVRRNAKKEEVGGILSHRLDRVCRNLRDAVRLKELEDDGVRLFFVDQQFGEGAAGQLSFNVLASVAQFYSDNLRSETLKGMDEKAQQGWLPTRPAFGYRNDTSDTNEPIKPVPEKAATVARIFELYSAGNLTLDSLAAKLKEEGHTYTPSIPDFNRRNLGFILNNRFYTGDLVWHGRVLKGKHQPLVDRSTFARCQAILSGKNRRVSKPNHPLGGGLFRCRYCGQALTGELVRRRRKSGTIREHMYYRCANNFKDGSHPVVRWRLRDLESSIESALAKLKLPSPEVTEWFREAVSRALTDESEFRTRTVRSLRKRETELETAQDRLLNAHLSGSVELKAFNEKNAEIKDELVKVREAMKVDAKVNQDYKDTALAVFNLTQRAAETWRGSNNSVRRELLDVFCLNREADDTSLYLTWRKPFDALAEQPEMKIGVPRGI